MPYRPGMPVKGTEQSSILCKLPKNQKFLYLGLMFYFRFDNLPGALLGSGTQSQGIV
jgi:hypothetical protein